MVASIVLGYIHQYVLTLRPNHIHCISSVPPLLSTVCTMMIPASSSTDENETDLLNSSDHSAEHVWEIQQHNDDDENHVVLTPLITMSSSPSSSVNSDEENPSLRQRRKRKRRLKSLELQMLAEEESTYGPGCLGDSWRFVASLVLTGLVALPFVLSKWRNHDNDDYDFFHKADPLPCISSVEKDPSLHVTSFSHAFQRIQSATNFCREVRYSYDCIWMRLASFVIARTPRDSLMTFFFA